ncbi:MAG: helix-turn-helix domain-containing protein [Pseudomonadota bacterium]
MQTSPPNRETRQTNMANGERFVRHASHASDAPRGLHPRRTLDATATQAEARARGLRGDRRRQKAATTDELLSPIEREALRSCLEQLVAGAFQLDELLLRVATRGKAEVARARQTAMYLAHTVCGLTLTEVGLVFERDRTTVAHACRTIEEQRENATFDRAVDMLERSARLIQVHVFAATDSHTAGEWL